MADRTHPHDRSLGKMAERARRLAAGRPDQDARGFDRQEDLADRQARAAEDMEDNQRRLLETEQRLARVREEVSGRAGDAREIERGAREPHARAEEIHRAADAIQPPDADR